MYNSLSFAEVLQALFPTGSLWNPAQTEFSYEDTSYTSSLFLADGTLTLTPDPGNWFRAGDSITITGSPANSGSYIVESVESTDTIHIVGSFTLEAGAAITVSRSTNAGALLRTLMGLGDNHQELKDFLQTLAYIREPKLTPILSDLEKEYGRLTDGALTVTERQEILHEIVYAPRGTGAASYLQDQLQSAGFSVYVYQNSPAYNPGAFYGGPGGTIITNNILYDRTIAEATQDQDLWPHVFFIGGTAVRDANDRIIHIDPVVISDAQKAAFRTAVLRAKPVHSWCVAVIEDNDYFTFSIDDNVITDTAKGFSNADPSTNGGFWWDGEFDTWTYVLVEDATLSALYDASGEYLIDG